MESQTLLRAAIREISFSHPEDGGATFKQICSSLEETLSLNSIEDAVKRLLWRGLYLHPLVKMFYLPENQKKLQDDEVSEATQKNVRRRGIPEIYEISSSLCDTVKFDVSRDILLNELGLLCYPEISKLEARTTILRAIASAKYNGCWQYKLAIELNISSKMLFHHLKALVNRGLVVKISMSLVAATHKHNASADISSSVLLWLHSFFDLEKVPRDVQAAIFSMNSHSIKESILRILNKCKNHTAMEADVRRFCFDRFFKQLSQDSRIRYTARTFSRMYARVRTNLLKNNEIKELKAWCLETKRFEQCVVLSSSILSTEKEIDNRSIPEGNVKCFIKTEESSVFLQSKQFSSKAQSEEEEDDENSGNTGKIHNEEDEESPQSDGMEEEAPIRLSRRVLRKSPLQDRKPVWRQILHLLRAAANFGMECSDLSEILSINRKRLAKILWELENTNLIVKKAHRRGKLFLYKYYLNFAPCSSLKRVKSEQNISLPENTQPLPVETSQPSPPKKIATELFNMRMKLLTDWVREMECVMIPELCRRLAESEKSEAYPDRKTIKRLMEKIMKVDRRVGCSKAELYSSRRPQAITAYYWTEAFTEEGSIKRTHELISEKRMQSMQDMKKTESLNVFGVKAESAKRGGSSPFLDSGMGHHLPLPKSIEEDGKSSPLPTENLKFDDSVESSMRASSSGVCTLHEDPKTSANVATTHLAEYTESMPKPEDGEFLIVERLAGYTEHPSLKKPSRFLLFDQKVLSDYGFVFPIMIRCRLLHAHLLSLAKALKAAISVEFRAVDDEERIRCEDDFAAFKQRNWCLSSTEIIQNMELETFLRVIGCGYRLPYIDEALTNQKACIKISDLPASVSHSVTSSKNPFKGYSPMLRRLLGILAKMHLVEPMIKRDSEPLLIPLSSIASSQEPSSCPAGSLKMKQFSADSSTFHAFRPDSLFWKINKSASVESFVSSDTHTHTHTKSSKKTSSIRGFFSFEEGASTVDSFWKAFEREAFSWIHLHSLSYRSLVFQSSLKWKKRNFSAYRESTQKETASMQLSSRRRSNRDTPDCEEVFLPENMKIPEAFKKKNWKGQIFLTLASRVKLEAYAQDMLFKHMKKGEKELGTEILTPANEDIQRLSKQLKLPPEAIIRFLSRKFLISEQSADERMKQSAGLIIVSQTRHFRYKCHVCGVLYALKPAMIHHYQKIHQLPLPASSEVYMLAAPPIAENLRDSSSSSKQEAEESTKKPSKAFKRLLMADLLYSSMKRVGIPEEAAWKQFLFQRISENGTDENFMESLVLCVLNQIKKDEEVALIFGFAVAEKLLMSTEQAKSFGARANITSLPPERNRVTQKGDAIISGELEEQKSDFTSNTDFSLQSLKSERIFGGEKLRLPSSDNCIWELSSFLTDLRYPILSKILFSHLVLRNQPNERLLNIYRFTKENVLSHFHRLSYGISRQWSSHVPSSLSSSNLANYDHPITPPFHPLIVGEQSPSISSKRAHTLRNPYVRARDNDDVGWVVTDASLLQARLSSLRVILSRNALKIFLMTPTDYFRTQWAEASLRELKDVEIAAIWENWSKLGWVIQRKATSSIMDEDDWHANHRFASAKWIELANTRKYALSRYSKQCLFGRLRDLWFLRELYISTHTFQRQLFKEKAFNATRFSGPEVAFFLENLAAENLDFKPLLDVSRCKKTAKKCIFGGIKDAVAFPPEEEAVPLGNFEATKSSPHIAEADAFYPKFSSSVGGVETHIYQLTSDMPNDASGVKIYAKRKPPSVCSAEDAAALNLEASLLNEGLTLNKQCGGLEPADPWQLPPLLSIDVLTRRRCRESPIFDVDKFIDETQEGEGGRTLGEVTENFREEGGEAREEEGQEQGREQGREQKKEKDQEEDEAGKAYEKEEIIEISEGKCQNKIISAELTKQRHQTTDELEENESFIQQEESCKYFGENYIDKNLIRGNLHTLKNKSISSDDGENTANQRQRDAFFSSEDGKRHRISNAVNLSEIEGMASILREREHQVFASTAKDDIPPLDRRLELDFFTLFALLLRTVRTLLRTAWLTGLAHRPDNLQTINDSSRESNAALDSVTDTVNTALHKSKHLIGEGDMPTKPSKRRKVSSAVAHTKEDLLEVLSAQSNKSRDVKAAHLTERQSVRDPYSSLDGKDYSNLEIKAEYEPERVCVRSKTQGKTCGTKLNRSENSLLLDSKSLSSTSFSSCRQDLGDILLEDHQHPREPPYYINLPAHTQKKAPPPIPSKIHTDKPNLTHLSFLIARTAKVKPVIVDAEASVFPQHQQEERDQPLRVAFLVLWAFLEIRRGKEEGCSVNEVFNIFKRELSTEEEAHSATAFLSLIEARRKQLLEDEISEFQALVDFDGKQRFCGVRTPSFPLRNLLGFGCRHSLPGEKPRTQISFSCATLFEGVKHSIEAVEAAFRVLELLGFTIRIPCAADWRFLAYEYCGAYLVKRQVAREFHCVYAADEANDGVKLRRTEKSHRRGSFGYHSPSDAIDEDAVRAKIFHPYLGDVRRALHSDSGDAHTKLPRDSRGVFTLPESSFEDINLNATIKDEDTTLFTDRRFFQRALTSSTREFRPFDDEPSSSGGVQALLSSLASNDALTPSIHSSNKRALQHRPAEDCEDKAIHAQSRPPYIPVRLWNVWGSSLSTFEDEAAALKTLLSSLFGCLGTIETHELLSLMEGLMNLSHREAASSWLLRKSDDAPTHGNGVECTYTDDTRNESLERAFSQVSTLLNEHLEGFNEVKNAKFPSEHYGNYGSNAVYKRVAGGALSTKHAQAELAVEYAASEDSFAASSRKPAGLKSRKSCFSSQAQRVDSSHTLQADEANNVKHRQAGSRGAALSKNCAFFPAVDAVATAEGVLNAAVNEEVISESFCSDFLLKDAGNCELQEEKEAFLGSVLTPAVVSSNTSLQAANAKSELRNIRKLSDLDEDMPEEVSKNILCSSDVCGNDLEVVKEDEAYHEDSSPIVREHGASSKESTAHIPNSQSLRLPKTGLNTRFFLLPPFLTVSTIRQSDYVGMCVWVRMDGYLNCSVLGLLSLRIWQMLREHPGMSLQQIHAFLVLLDICEVDFLLKGLVEEEILLLHAAGDIQGAYKTEERDLDVDARRRRPQEGRSLQNRSILCLTALLPKICLDESAFYYANGSVKVLEKFSRLFIAEKPLKK